MTFENTINSKLFSLPSTQLRNNAGENILANIKEIFPFALTFVLGLD